MKLRSLDKAAELPQTKATWQGTLRLAPAWIAPKGKPKYRPYLMFVVEAESGLIRLLTTEDQRPAPEAVFSLLVNAMAQLNALEQAGHHDLRVHIFLDEGEIDLALEALAMLKQQVRFHSHQTDLEVAQATEATRPETSIAIYIDTARRLINERGRGNYAAAASYLARVRELLRKAGQSARWKELIAQIREENRRLPALRNELDQAGL